VKPTLEQLMTIRNEAYLAALALGFKSRPATTAWRKANADYVAARDAETLS
jgi:hypothetical protein